MGDVKYKGNTKFRTKENIIIVKVIQAMKCMGTGKPLGSGTA